MFDGNIFFLNMQPSSSAFLLAFSRSVLLVETHTRLSVVMLKAALLSLLPYLHIDLDIMFLHNGEKEKRKEREKRILTGEMTNAKVC